MKKSLFTSMILVLMLTLCFTPPVLAQVSEEGGSGLLRVQRGMTSGQGQWTFGFFSRYFHQDLETDASEDIYNFRMNANATFALTDNLELTGTLPCIGWIRLREDAPLNSLENESLDEFAIGDVSAKLKMSLPVFTPRIRLAAEGFATFETGKEDTKDYPNVGYASPFTSNTTSYGVRGLLSISTQHSSIWPMLIHVNGGIRLSDDEEVLYYHSYPSPILDIPDAADDYTNKLLDWGLGAEFPFFSHLNFFGEVHSEMLIDTDDYIKMEENPIYAGGGIKIPFAGKSELTLSAVKLLSKDDNDTAFDPEDSFPEWQFVAGLSFSKGLYGGKPRMKRTPVPEAWAAEPQVVVPAPEPVVEVEEKTDDFFETERAEEPEVKHEVIEPIEPTELETVPEGMPQKEIRVEVIKEETPPPPPIQNFHQPLVVINMGQAPLPQYGQPLQWIDQDGKVYHLQPAYPQVNIPGQVQFMSPGQPMSAPPLPSVGADAAEKLDEPAVTKEVETTPAPSKTHAVPAKTEAAPLQKTEMDSLGDADFDGLANNLDKCPFAAEIYNGFLDEDGCPDAPPENLEAKDLSRDTDGDGIADISDKCATVAEDWDGFEDYDGCPDLDNDGDGIPDKVDLCPTLPETYNGLNDGDGCPEELETEEEEVVIDEEAEIEEQIKALDLTEDQVGKDGDGDGIQDIYDHCPTRQEDLDGYQDEDGCPDVDNDNDGINDSKDDCPNIPENFNGHQDDDGCPDISPEEKKIRKTDQDGDGLIDERDNCPTLAEDWDGFQDNDGCPDLDNDNDGIVDEKDECPNAPENFNGLKDKDGCPETEIQPTVPMTIPPVTDKPVVPEAVKPAAIEAEPEETPAPPVPEKSETMVDPAQPVEDDEMLAETPPPPVVEKPARPAASIFAGDYVYFESSSADFTQESLQVLSKVVTVMTNFPDITVEVAGYTDSTGAAELNRTLSEKRALMVRDELIKRGIAESRLTVKGYGEDNPIAPNDTAEGKAQNRRVAFNLLP